MLSSRAHSGASGRLITSSRVLPISRLASSVQTRSGWSVIRVGPGTMPYDVSAASRIEAVAVTGRPSASSGTNIPAALALLAASGPATPSMAPWPNSSASPRRPASLRSVM